MRVCARTQRHVSSAILFPFPFIAALPSLFAEHQHHLLFARSIYSVNYICLCSRYTAVVLSSVNCAFTFFPSLLLFTFLFVPFLFVRPSRSLISFAIWYSAQLAISHDIALHARSPPADWLYQKTFAGPFETDNKFPIRTTFFGVSADLSERAK